MPLSTWILDLEDIEKGGKIHRKKTAAERSSITEKVIFHKGDILYSRLRPYLLKVLIAPDDGLCTPEIIPFRTLEGISSSYLVLYLKSPYVNLLLSSKAYGVRMPRVGTKEMANLMIPIPPLEEQERIVDKFKKIEPYIERYFVAELEVSKLNQLFSAQLKKSILRWALQGNLVPQDYTNEPVRILLERIHTEKEKLVKEGKIKTRKVKTGKINTVREESFIFRKGTSYYEKLHEVESCIDDEIPFAIPNSWSWSRLHACLDIRDGTHNAPKYIDKGYPLITSKNLCNGTINFSTAKSISLQDYEAISKKANVDCNDILFAMIGSIGNPVLYVGDEKFSIKNVALFKSIKNGLNMHYVFWWLYFSQENIKQQAAGGVQPFVSLSYLRNYLIPIPPMEEQEGIVLKIEKLLPLFKEL